MRTILSAVIVLSACAASRSVDRPKMPVKACVKWSKDLPEAQAAGEGLFASVTRVEGVGPFPACDIVAETEEFGVGWLMSAYMKEAVLSPCGKRLGRYTFRYRGDQWQPLLVMGLYDYLSKHPEASAAAKECGGRPR